MKPHYSGLKGGEHNNSKKPKALKTEDGRTSTNGIQGLNDTVLHLLPAACCTDQWEMEYRPGFFSKTNKQRAHLITYAIYLCKQKAL